MIFSSRFDLIKFIFFISFSLCSIKFFPKIGKPKLSCSLVLSKSVFLFEFLKSLPLSEDPSTLLRSYMVSSPVRNLILNIEFHSMIHCPK